MSNYEKEYHGKELLSWDLVEYEKRQNSKKWSFFAMVVVSILLLYAIVTSNFLFALFIVIASIVIIMNENKESILLKFSIVEDGIILGDRFYEYARFNDFSIIYKPKENVKQLYFEFKNSLKQRLSIPLYDINPIVVRKELKNYLIEDLDRTNLPLSEQLSRILRL